MRLTREKEKIQKDTHFRNKSLYATKFLVDSAKTQQTNFTRLSFIIALIWRLSAEISALLATHTHTCLCGARFPQSGAAGGQT